MDDKRTTTHFSISLRDLLLVVLLVSLVCNASAMWHWHYAVTFLAACSTISLCLRSRSQHRIWDATWGVIIGAIVIHTVTLAARHMKARGDIEQTGITATQCNNILSPEHQVPTTGVDYHYAHYVSRDYRRQFVRCTIHYRDVKKYFENYNATVASDCVAATASPPPFEQAPSWWPQMRSMPVLSAHNNGVSGQHLAGEYWFYMQDSSHLFGYFYAGN